MALFIHHKWILFKAHRSSQHHQHPPSNPPTREPHLFLDFSKALCSQFLPPFISSSLHPSLASGSTPFIILAIHQCVSVDKGYAYSECDHPKLFSLCSVATARKGGVRPERDKLETESTPEATTPPPPPPRLSVSVSLSLSLSVCLCLSLSLCVRRDGVGGTCWGFFERRRH